MELDIIEFREAVALINEGVTQPGYFAHFSDNICSRDPAGISFKSEIKLGVTHWHLVSVLKHNNVKLADITALIELGRHINGLSKLEIELADDNLANTFLSTDALRHIFKIACAGKLDFVATSNITYSQRYFSERHFSFISLVNDKDFPDVKRITSVDKLLKKYGYDPYDPKKKRVLEHCAIADLSNPFRRDPVLRALALSPKS